MRIDSCWLLSSLSRALGGAAVTVFDSFSYGAVAGAAHGYRHSEIISQILIYYFRYKFN
jgi:hypothetical protein